jgi:hypothetical protein
MSPAVVPGRGVEVVTCRVASVVAYTTAFLA